MDVRHSVSTPPTFSDATSVLTGMTVVKTMCIPRRENAYACNPGRKETDTGRAMQIASCFSSTALILKIPIAEQISALAQRMSNYFVPLVLSSSGLDAVVNAHIYDRIIDLSAPTRQSMSFYNRYSILFPKF